MLLKYDKSKKLKKQLIYKTIDKLMKDKNTLNFLKKLDI